MAITDYTLTIRNLHNQVIVTTHYESMAAAFIGLDYLARQMHTIADDLAGEGDSFASGQFRDVHNDTELAGTWYIKKQVFA